MEEEEEVLKPLVALQPCRQLAISAFFQKHHLQMIIILTLRQQSVLQGLAFRKPQVSNHTMYCYSVFSICLFPFDPKLCVISKMSGIARPRNTDRKIPILQ